MEPGSPYDSHSGQTGEGCRVSLFSHFMSLYLLYVLHNQVCFLPRMHLFRHSCFAKNGKGSTEGDAEAEPPSEDEQEIVGTARQKTFMSGTACLLEPKI